MSYSSSDPPTCCSTASPALKLYQAFIFSVPIFFTSILLLLFYLFYLRRRRVDWSSLRMRTTYQARGITSRPSDSGLKKEFREMLPIIVFSESFFIREAQCSVCLGDYQAEDRLQQIPTCGHTFHMECIDLWLSTNTTCPLCRVSLIPPSRSPTPEPHPAPLDHVIIQQDQANEIVGVGVSEGGSEETVVEERRRDCHCGDDHDCEEEDEFWDATIGLGAAAEEFASCDGQVSVVIHVVEAAHDTSVEQRHTQRVVGV